MTPAQVVRAHPEIESLVERARNGDLGAFEALYHALGGQVYGVCLRMAEGREQADEWAQDVWVRAWERLGSFRGDAAFSTWLHRLSVNLILDRKREEGRRNARFLREEEHGGFENAPARGILPGAGIDLGRAVQALPAGARMVFLLHDVEGFKHREIASRLGIAEGTVKAQLHRARKLLKEALDR